MIMVSLSVAIVLMEEKEASISVMLDGIMVARRHRMWSAMEMWVVPLDVIAVARLQVVMALRC